MKGNDNVDGNNVAGSGNVVGNNNNVTTPAPMIVPPGSIGITGGNVTNPTVNNFGTTEWHLSDSQKAALGVFADSLPDVSTSDQINNREIHITVGFMPTANH